MSITSIIYHDMQYIETIASGEVTFDEISNHLLNSFSNDGVYYAELVDSRLAQPKWSTEETHHIVKLLKDLSKGPRLGPLAVVVSDDYSFGMIRMLAFLLDDVCTVRSFHDYDMAKEWLRNQRVAGA